MHRAEQQLAGQHRGAERQPDDDQTGDNLAQRPEDQEVEREDRNGRQDADPGELAPDTALRLDREAIESVIVLLADVFERLVENGGAAEAAGLGRKQEIRSAS